MRYRTNVPYFTESLVQHLCEEALTATSKEDLDRIMPALRLALEAHIHLAKESLTTQVATISALESEKVA